MAGGSQLTCTYQGCGGHHQPDKHVIYRLCLMTGSLSAQVLPQFYDLRAASHDCVHPLWLPRLDVWSTRSTGCGGVCGQRWVPKNGNILRWNGVLKITQKESPEVLVILVVVGLVVRQLTLWSRSLGDALLDFHLFPGVFQEVSTHSFPATNRTDNETWKMFITISSIFLDCQVL